jgi:hypothetical protein
MIEFLWILIFIASVAGYYWAREARLGHDILGGPPRTQPKATSRAVRGDADPANRQDPWPTRFLDWIITRISGMEFRWLLFIGFLLGLAIYYVFIKKDILRAVLNLILFFEWHTVLMTVLLGISLAALLFSWRTQLTIGKWLTGAALIGAVALLLSWKWYCFLVLVAAAVLTGVLFRWRDRAKKRAWFGLTLVVFLIMALFLSQAVLNEIPDSWALFWASFSDLFWDLFLIAVLVVLSIKGILLGRRRLVTALRDQPGDRRAVFRGAFLVWISAFIITLIAVAFVMKWRGVDVPYWFDIVGDWVQLILAVIMISVAYEIVMSARWQPLGWVSAVLSVFLAGGLFLSAMLYGQPEDYADIEDQFKYGSIGSDHFFARGFPYYLWQILPKMFPPEEILKKVAPNKVDYLPRYGKDHQKGKSFEALGFWKEDERTIRVVDHDEDMEIDRPIGFSKRKVFGVDFIGMNCAFCHASTLRTQDKPEPHVILLMPANTVDTELYFLYLFGVAKQERFRSGNLWDEQWRGSAPDEIKNELPESRRKRGCDDPMLDAQPHLMGAILCKYKDLKLGAQLAKDGIWGLCREIENSYQRLVYRWLLIPLAEHYLTKLEKSFAFIDPTNANHNPRFGPGRVDAWSPGKRTLLNPPLPVVYPGGIIDDTSIWNQKARKGQRFHWDGNSNDIQERNIIAGLVVNGPQIEMLDKARVFRITDWTEERPAPRFDDYFLPADRKLFKETPVERLRILENGRKLFQHWCASCHAPDGDRVGRVEPIDFRELNTDPARLRAFTKELQDRLNRITRKSPNRDDPDTQKSLNKDDPEKDRGWELRNFRMQDGYVNMLLDGIWARAPYLHNGSVPTLRALLDLPCKHEVETNCRPKSFYRGIDLYDTENVGFVSDWDWIEPGDTIEVMVRRNEKEKEEKDAHVVDAEGKIHINSLTRGHTLDIPVGNISLSEARKNVIEKLREDRRKESKKPKKPYEEPINRGEPVDPASGSSVYTGSRNVTPTLDDKIDRELKMVRLAVIGKKRDSPSDSHYVGPGDTIEVLDPRNGNKQSDSSIVDAEGKQPSFGRKFEELNLSKSTVDDAKIQVKRFWYCRPFEGKTRKKCLGTTNNEEFNNYPLVVTIHKTQYFRFDTRLPGNSNTGHLYGTDLTDSEKDALVEFMKGL